jgi:5-methylcytosine-specific restriction endonuclease McrA
MPSKSPPYVLREGESFIVDDGVPILIDRWGGIKKKQWVELDVVDRDGTLIRPALVASLGTARSRRSLSRRDRAAVLSQAKGMCNLCERSLGVDVHIDHVTPLADGGTSDLTNLAAVHRDCKRAKGAWAVRPYWAWCVITTDPRGGERKVPPRFRQRAWADARAGLHIDEEARVAARWGRIPGRSKKIRSCPAVASRLDSSAICGGRGQLGR